MNRLQKKACIASAGMHLLLALILLVGPAFLAPSSRQTDAVPLTFVPSMLVDANVIGGGNPNARPPAPAPPAPAQTHVAPPPQRQPEPARERALSQTDPDSLEVSSERKPHKPEISLKPVTRRPSSQQTSKTSAEAQEERARKEAQQELASRLGSAANNIRPGSASKFEPGEFGPGGGGPAYAGYASWVLTVYENAWVVPQDATAEDAVTMVDVTIASDGRVLSSRIKRRSGDAAVDASVQRTLDRVTTMGRPFPSGATDKQRSYTIPFNLKVKRGTA